MIINEKCFQICETDIRLPNFFHPSIFISHPTKLGLGVMASPQMSGHSSAAFPTCHGKPGKLQLYFPGLENSWKKYLSIKKIGDEHFYRCDVIHSITI